MLDILGRLLGAEDLKKPIIKARDAAKKAVKDLLKKILDKLKGFLGKSNAKKSQDEKDSLPIAINGKFKSGTEYKLYVTKTGELDVSWNPNCTTEQLDLIYKEAVDLASQAAKKNEAVNKTGSGKVLSSLAKQMRLIQTRLSSYDAVPDGFELKKGWRCPRNGLFTGLRCNSNFIPCDREALGIGKTDVIPFKDGYPDFSKWQAEKSFEVDEGLCGKHDIDMPRIYRAYAKLKGLANQTAAQNFIDDHDWTAHHAGGNTVQLIPYKLHDGIRHTGGAFQARDSGVSC